MINNELLNNPAVNMVILTAKEENLNIAQRTFLITSIVYLTKMNNNLKNIRINL